MNKAQLGVEGGGRERNHATPMRKKKKNLSGEDRKIKQNQKVNGIKKVVLNYFF